MRVSLIKLQDNIYDIIIIGAGASGLISASLIKNRSILILEQNSTIANKLKASGGAKCNVTNSVLSTSNYLANQDFISKSILQYDNNSFLEYLNLLNLKPILQNKIVKGQYFFNSSSEFINALKIATKEHKILLNTKVIDVDFDNIFKVKTKTKTFLSKNIIVATGGTSFEALGVSDLGYKIAKKFKHQVFSPLPALVGFTVQPKEFWFKSLSGISTDVKITIYNKIFTQSMLFTHKGCSGPAIFNASLYWHKGTIEIDFLPNIDLKKLLKNSNKFISTLLPLPKKMIQEYLNAVGLKDKSVKNLNEDELKAIYGLKEYIFAPAGTFGLKSAEVVKGGVATNEIDSNMQSKKQKGLYFIGEVLDVTGELGGYNIQWAYSSARTVVNSF